MSVLLTALSAPVVSLTEGMLLAASVYLVSHIQK